ncbi:hypothetical protein HOLleu_32743 [Holothuria leucospilota]|uniref:Uncharacterized protein n=1 Tax=Holothuria leucospilota TaxID=206669 RepID=A0A9Q1H099_HOLLE|nr:hypothetical protein HOLleu_32743 [Holothuria leucospilota]
MQGFYSRTLQNLTEISSVHSPAITRTFLNRNSQSTQSRHYENVPCMHGSKQCRSVVRPRKQFSLLDNSRKAALKLNSLELSIRSSMDSIRCS